MSKHSNQHCNCILPIKGTDSYLAHPHGNGIQKSKSELKTKIKLEHGGFDTPFAASAQGSSTTVAFFFPLYFFASFAVQIAVYVFPCLPVYLPHAIHHPHPAGAA
jgi:hypothetical protein